jgi:PIN like domain
VWIPQVSAWGWLIITRDRHIQDHQAEIDSVRNYGARMIALSGNEARDTFAQLEIVMCRWRDIEGCLEKPGPFIYTATRTTLKPVALS